MSHDNHGAALATTAAMPYGEDMNARTRQLLDELLVLPAEERALMAAELEASLDEDENAPSPEQVGAAWTEELKTRLDDVVCRPCERA